MNKKILSNIGSTLVEFTSIVAATWSSKLLMGFSIRKFSLAALRFGIVPGKAIKATTRYLIPLVKRK